MTPEIRTAVERIERERERLRGEWANRRFVVDFGDYLADPDPKYSVPEKKGNSRVVLARSLSEPDARQLADQYEAKYPDGLPPNWLWDHLPEQNKRAVRRTLQEAAQRLLHAHTEHVTRGVTTDADCHI
jgi:hypothetical protein